MIIIRVYALLFQPISNCKHQSIFDDLKLEQMYQQVTSLRHDHDQNQSQSQIKNDDEKQNDKCSYTYWNDVRKIKLGATEEYLVPRTLVVTSKNVYLVDENYSMWFSNYKATNKQKISQSWWRFGAHNSRDNSQNRRTNVNGGIHDRPQQFLLISKENVVI